MNLRYIINAIGRFGIKGIINYFLRKPKELAFQRLLQSTTTNAPPIRGITLIANFGASFSLSKVMRDLALRLKEAGIPYQTLNVPRDTSIPSSDMQGFLTPEHDFRADKYTHIITMRKPISIANPRCKSHSITFWEFESGLLHGCPEILQAKNILAFSDFNQRVFCNELPKSIKVKKILYPFQFRHGQLPPRELTRTKYGIGVNDFVVFFNFDYFSSYFRKNPEGILTAFAKALSDKADAKLVFKTMRAQKCKHMSDRLHAMAEKLGLNSQLITIDDFIPQENLVNLTNACDVYMSLHRGEGFGLGIAEAMSLGKPVIVTNYSSTTEFCNPNNSMLIPHTMVAVHPDQIDNETYRKVSTWAEPDCDSAAKALLRLYSEPDLRKKVGDAAKNFIKEYFSVENFRRSINAFLST